jgi:hypothetical protein
LRDLKEREHLPDLHVKGRIIRKKQNSGHGVSPRAIYTDGRIIIKIIFKKYGFRIWAGFIWLRTSTSGGLP